jgi:O-antigen ligase
MNETKINSLSGLIFVLYLAFFVSLIFSFRAISSISIGSILIAGFIKNEIEQKTFFNPQLKTALFILCCLMFLLQLASLLYTNNIHEGWKNIQLKSAIILIPLTFYCCTYIDESVRQKILKWFCIILFVACLLALYNSFRTYLATKNSSVFLYHSLVKIYSGHAIQFSIFIFISLLHLFEMHKKNQTLFTKSFHFFLILFFLVFLFLLSSKLVIIFFLFYFLFVMINFSINRSVSNPFIITSVISIALLSSLIFSTKNPINNRFKDILETNFNFLKKEKFSPSEYFNGLQFRLLQWRFVPQILNEKNAWLTGVSVGDAQSCLDQKYISENMYTGTPARGDKGFIGYNTHNEFLESLLQTGIPGLVLFVLISVALIKGVIGRKSAELSFVTILLIIYSFTESVFESQYSLLIYLFFPLFFSSAKLNRISE